MIGLSSPSKSTMSHFPSTTRNKEEKSPPKRCLDLSCGDPYFNLRQEQREMNEDEELEIKI